MKYQLMPDLDDATYAALRDSIDKFGVLVPVIFDQHGNIIDGHNRAAIAEELGKKFPRETKSVRDDDEGRDLVRVLNACRRHLEPSQRREIVAELRSEGHSLRAIASAVGTSKTQVERDLDQVSPPGTPDEVNGQDGKKYPARKPPPRSLTPFEATTIAEKVNEWAAAAGDKTVRLRFREAFGDDWATGLAASRVGEAMAWLEERISEVVGGESDGTLPPSEGEPATATTLEEEATEPARGDPAPPRAPRPERSTGKPPIPKNADQRRHGGEMMVGLGTFLNAWKGHGGSHVWDIAFGQTAGYNPELAAEWREKIAEAHTAIGQMLDSTRASAA